MSINLANQLCKSMPSAEWSDPWGGHDTWKIGGKMFANIGARRVGIALKTASIQDAQHLQDMFGWPKAPYMHRSWVHVPFDLPEDEMRHRIETSYTLIRASLTKKAKADLAPFSPPE